MKKLLLLPLVCLSLYGEQLQYNIDTLIEKALLSSPDLNVSRDSFKISQQRTTQADADYLPQVDLYAGAGQVGITSSATTENGTLITGKITASQLIYDFGKTSGQMEYYAEESNASFASYNQEISDNVTITTCYAKRT
jgi:outer membrane protein